MIVLLVGVAVMALGVIGGCKKETPQPAPKAPAAATEIAQKLCPVMGDPINPEIYVDYQGRRIYFCCSMCPETFKKDPEKYLKKLDEQMKEAAPQAAPAEHEFHHKAE
jgi:YHS domain-containing protein